MDADLDRMTRDQLTGPIPVVPEWPEFMRGCVRYRQSLDTRAPDASRTNEP